MLFLFGIQYLRHTVHPLNLYLSLDFYSEFLPSKAFSRVCVNNLSSLTGRWWLGGMNVYECTVSGQQIHTANYCSTRAPRLAVRTLKSVTSNTGEYFTKPFIIWSIPQIFLVLPTADIKTIKTSRLLLTNWKMFKTNGIITVETISKWIQIRIWYN